MNLQSLSQLKGHVENMTLTVKNFVQNMVKILIALSTTIRASFITTVPVVKKLHKYHTPYF